MGLVQSWHTGSDRTAFAWEIVQLYESGRLPSVNFWSGDEHVINPFAGG